MFQIISIKTLLCLSIVFLGIYFNLINKNEQMSATTVTTNAGIQMPRLIYGTAWKKEATTSLVIKAILNGFRGIDTACQPKHYR
jgi:hypothetical protein